MLGPRTPGERWNHGTEHDPRSVALYLSIADIDFTLGGDYFGWKHGGDGDNGECLMYLFDEHFQRQDENQTGQTGKPVPML